jgi:hypothetical protein
MSKRVCVDPRHRVRSRLRSGSYQSCRPLSSIAAIHPKSKAFFDTLSSHIASAPQLVFPQQLRLVVLHQRQQPVAALLPLSGRFVRVPGVDSSSSRLQLQPDDDRLKGAGGGPVTASQAARLQPRSLGRLKHFDRVFAAAL